MSNYINHYCWKSTISAFRYTEKAEWLERMADRSRTVHRGQAGPEQIKAWESSFDILQEAFFSNPGVLRQSVGHF